ncbi:MerR family transcriptional regulator [Hyalangium rubrum]|uniref:MerR family transcriptional regulator n=1 Tax=Hyalangium rubrum TaxID=3103134 RepID=A0ABU5HI25_9BACT|nr:MerR family transcriptional regulator [Hyalangium sp. s54d21]MDY7232794.1 MerR family transcriptional regulator [Hyalangium sp. s54d21]
MAERTHRIHVAARLSGVREELIRAWERRYGVPRPQRTPSGYRMYTDADVEVLKRLKQLTEEGVPISEAVKLLPGREAEPVRRPRQPPVEVSGTAVEGWRARVLQAALAYDQRQVAEVLDEVLAALPPLKAFDEVLAPVQREVGDRWHAGALTVAQEHLVSQVVRARLVSLLHAAPENEGARHAVLACFPEEQHEVGLLGAALRLRHAGLRVTLLGQRVPARDLGQLVAELRPDVVGLSAVMDPGAKAFERQLAELLAALPPDCPVWVGGAAAQAHPEVCERLGARLFQPNDWDALAV